MTDRGGWARGGMVVVALGVASNLVLTFVPDVVPDQVGPVVVRCMTAVIVLVAPPPAGAAEVARDRGGRGRTQP